MSNKPAPTPSLPTANNQSPEPRKQRTMPNDIQTLAKIDRLLSDMDPEEAERILDWLVGKYSKTAVVMRAMMNPGHYKLEMGPPSQPPLVRREPLAGWCQQGTGCDQCDSERAGNPYKGICIRHPGIAKK